MEQNKTGKYLKYAIGEIVLVVIGILIALQINNANNFKKERVLEKQYMSSLLNDLKSDMDKINTAISGNKDLLNGLDMLLELLADPTMDLEKQRLTYLYSVKYTYWYLTVEFSDITLSQLKNAGDFQLIQHKEIADAIINYSKSIEACNQIKEEMENYFHAFENTQKGIFNLSLAKPVYELIEEDIMNMFLPLETFDTLIKTGNYFLNNDPLLIGRYYNDILFYRTTLNNMTVYLNTQNQIVIDFEQLIKDTYKL